MEMYILCQLCLHRNESYPITFFSVRIHIRSKTEEKKKKNKLKNAKTECFIKHRVKTDYSVAHIYSHSCGNQISSKRQVCVIQA